MTLEEIQKALQNLDREVVDDALHLIFEESEIEINTGAADTMHQLYLLISLIIEPDCAALKVLQERHGYA